MSSPQNVSAVEPSHILTLSSGIHKIPNSTNEPACGDRWYPDAFQRNRRSGNLPPAKLGISTQSFSIKGPQNPEKIHITNILQNRSQIVNKMTQSDAPWLEGIDGSEARKLIESNSQVIRVIAGPGSGKTTCLQSRIQKLVMKDGIAPSRIYVGTFTRAIAKELRNRIDSNSSGL